MNIIAVINSKKLRPLVIFVVVYLSPQPISLNE